LPLDPGLLDAWFMQAFLALVNSNIEFSRQCFLRILQSDDVLQGRYVLRFLPMFRMHVNLFEDFVFQVMPTTADAAAILARLYLIEERVHEAKKVIHPAFRTYKNNPIVPAMWAQTMVVDGAPKQVIEEIDRNTPYHSGASELDLLQTFYIGRAFFDLGDFRSGIYHWESILGHTRGKNPRLLDRFRIHLAKAYQSKGYLLDTFEVLQTVEDGNMMFDDGEEVSFVRGRLIERINANLRQGIVKPLKFTEVHEYPRNRSPHGFLEIERRGESPA